MRPILFVILIFLIFINSNINAQVILKSDSLIGFWQPDSALTGSKKGDTISFTYYGANGFHPHAIKFLERGKYKTVKFWAWCGTRSTYEKIFGLNKTTYRKGHWKLKTIDSSTYLLLRDNKIGKVRLKIIAVQPKTLVFIQQSFNI